MMTAKEKVLRAIERKNPPGIPLYYCNRYMERSDILFFGAGSAADFKPEVPGQTEWGFVWKTHDKTIGQTQNPPLAESWELLDSYQMPDPNAKGRFEGVRQQAQLYRNRFLIGDMGITGFNHITFMRGFENTLEDLYLAPEQLCKLMDLVFSYEKEIIKNFARCEMDAVAFFDDWGTQRALMIQPELWRQFFKERYREQFQLAHSLGMKVFFHSCGQVYDIIPDLIEIGTDLLNLNQPDLFGIEKLGQEFGGRVCFVCPVDHQTVAIHGTRTEIFDYVKRLTENLGCFSGGLIGLIEEYSSVGMSPEAFEAIVEAFEMVRN